MKFWILFIIINAVCIHCEGNATLTWLEEFARKFGQKINVDLVENESSMNQLKLIYESYHPVVKTIDPSSVLQEKLNSLQTIFKTAENKVEELAKAGQDIKRSINTSMLFTSDQVRFYNKTTNESTSDTSSTAKYYFNAKCGCGLQLPDGYSADDCFLPLGGFSESKQLLGQNVSFESSAVHVPLEVYNEGAEVLRDISWTQNLEPMFKKQMCSASNQPKTRWVFVGTNSGVFRYFPGKLWNPGCSTVDLHDTTKSPWFVQGIASPKDVLVMIDTSGSIIGITLSLIKSSVAKLMTTLAGNDFFNIFVFNQKAEYLEKSCPGLIQATPINKQMAVSWLDKLKVHNSSSFDVGFEFGFSVLNQSEASNTTTRPIRAGCNSIILLFTDGGAAYPGRTFQKWNLDKKVRVFTYSVGKPFSSTTTLNEMACNNRGEFTSIPSYSATYLQTRKYMSKLGQPLAFSTQKTNKWTLPYEDHIGSIGSVMTVTRPIHDDYIDVVTGKRRLGITAVVGTDVLHDDVKRALDVAELGSTSYSFGIDNNGFLFHHPNLKKGRLNEPVTVDLMDVSMATNISQLRSKMIDRLTESVRISDNVVSDDKNHLDETDSIFAISAVPDSLFSVGISIPVHRMNRLDADAVVGSRRISIENIVFNDSNIRSFVFGLQCNRPPQTTDCNDASVTTPIRSDILMSDVTSDTLCPDGEIPSTRLNDLLLHGSVSRRLAISYWRDRFAESSSVMSVFVASDSVPCVLRVKHISPMYREEIESILSDPATKDFFKRSVHDRSTVTTYSVVRMPSVDATMQIDDVTTAAPANVTTSPPDVTTSSTFARIFTPTFIVASRPVKLSTSPRVFPAVSGAVLDPELLKSQFFNLSSQTCEGDHCRWSYNCWNQDRMCIVIDDGAMLVLTNQDAHVAKLGQFFGSIDGELLKALERDGFYARAHIDDHQVVCKVEGNNGNAATRSFIFVENLLNILKWMISSTWVVIQTIVYITMTSVEAVTSPTTVEFAFSEVEAPSGNLALRHCVLRRTIFRFGARSSPFEGEAECLDICNRTYHAARIPHTNLLMVVADTGAQCYNDHDFCFNAMAESELRFEVTGSPCAEKRHRAAPSECFDVETLPEELDVACGSPTNQRIILLEIFSLLCLALLLR